MGGCKTIDERPLSLLPTPPLSPATATATAVRRANLLQVIAERLDGGKQRSRSLQALVFEGSSCYACHAEQIRAAQQLTDEQVEKLVWQTRSRTKAYHTQAAPSACASTSKAPSSSSSSEESEESASISRVGQNHVYTVYVRYFWLGNHQIYGVYIRIYTVLANPKNQ